MSGVYLKIGILRQSSNSRIPTSPTHVPVRFQDVAKEHLEKPPRVLRNKEFRIEMETDIPPLDFFECLKEQTSLMLKTMRMQVRSELAKKKATTSEESVLPTEETQEDLLFTVTELYNLLKDYHPALRGDVRFQRLKQIQELFMIGKNETKSDTIDFFAFDKGMWSFLDFLEVIIGLKISNIPNTINIEQIRDAYSTLTLNDRVKILSMQVTAQEKF